MLKAARMLIRTANNISRFPSRKKAFKIYERVGICRCGPNFDFHSSDLPSGWSKNGGFSLGYATHATGVQEQNRQEIQTERGKCRLVKNII